MTVISPETTLPEIPEYLQQNKKLNLDFPKTDVSRQITIYFLFHLWLKCLCEEFELHHFLNG